MTLCLGISQSCPNEDALQNMEVKKTLQISLRGERPHPTRLGLDNDEDFDVTVRSLVAQLLAKLGGASRDSSPLSANVSRTSDPSRLERDVDC